MKRRAGPADVQVVAAGSVCCLAVTIEGMTASVPLSADEAREVARWLLAGADLADCDTAERDARA